MKTEQAQMPDNTRPPLWRGIILAVFFWVLYTFYLDTAIATNLRQISAVIAENLLALIPGQTVEISRQGTVLFTTDMSFEVIGACSGSTTLKVMLGAAIILSITWQGLRLYQRLAALLGAALLALIFNGIRVAALVLLAIWRGQVIEEGTLHSAIGIASFCLCFAAYLGLCRALSRLNRRLRRAQQQTSASTAGAYIRLILSLPLLGLIFAPFIRDLLTSWHPRIWSHSNEYGVIYFFAPLCLAFIQTGIYRRLHLPQARPELCRQLYTILLGCGLLIPLLCRLLDVTALSGTGLLLILSAIALQFSDLRNTLLTLPLLLLPLLGFPRILLRLDELRPDALTLSPETIRLALALTVTALQLLLYTICIRQTLRQKQKTRTPLPHPSQVSNSHLLSFSLSALTLLLFIPGVTAHTPHNSQQELQEKLNLPYYLPGGWIGRDLELSPSDIAYFGAKNLIYREYTEHTRGSGAQPTTVQLLITFSAGDRHKNHPPEFCQSGAGWETTAREQLTLESQPPRELTLVDLAQGAKKKYLLYFFASQEEESTELGMLVLLDLYYQLQGRPQEWALIRIFSASKSAALTLAQKLPSPLFPKNAK